MEDTVYYLGNVLAGLALLIAGVRVLRLAVQTKRAPERFLSARRLIPDNGLTNAQTGQR